MPKAKKTKKARGLKSSKKLGGVKPLTVAHADISITKVVDKSSPNLF